MFCKKTNLRSLSVSLFPGRKAGKNKLVLVSLLTILLSIGSCYTYAQTDTAVIEYKNDTAHFFTVTKSGKVGIGTGAPLSQLHTTGTVRFNRYRNSILLDSVLATDADGNLVLVPKSAGFDWTQRYIGDRAVNFRSAGNAAFGTIGWYNGDWIRLHSADSNAQVGSGASVNLRGLTNTFTMEANASPYMANIIGTPTQLQFLVFDITRNMQNSILLKADKIEFPKMRNNAMGDSVLTTDANGVLKFKFIPPPTIQMDPGWYSDGEHVYNGNTGNIAIGTQTPTAKLHTLGSVRFESYKNNLQGDSVLTTDVNGNLKFTNKSGFDWNNTFTGEREVKFKHIYGPYLGNLRWDGNYIGMRVRDTTNMSGSGFYANAESFTLFSNNSEGTVSSGIRGTSDALSFTAYGSDGGNYLTFRENGFTITKDNIQFLNLHNNAAGDSVLTTDVNGNLKFKYVSLPQQEDNTWTLDGINIYNKNTGNVGIGTLTPSAKLHANGKIRFESYKNNLQYDSVLTTDTEGNLKFVYMPYGSGGGSGSSYSFMNGITQFNGNVSLGGQLQDSVKVNLSGYQFSFNNGAEKVLHMAADGNVGIGTRADAMYRLAIDGGDVNVGHQFDTAGRGSKLFFGGYGNTDPFYIQRYNVRSDVSELRVNIGDDGATTNDRFHIGYVGAGTNTWNSIFVSEASGRAGIGTEDITGELSVGKLHGSKLTVGNSQWAKKDIIVTSWDGTNGDYTDLLVPGNVTNSAFMRINQYGNVGIGTLMPDAQYKLSVNGRIRAKGLRVQSAGWSDFVFEPDYKLLSLTELEKFIKANKHLPEIPTAQDVMTNGQEVGEIQSKLLQKIEELTLYTIELNKQVKVLEDKNKKLETQQQQISQMQQQLDELKKLIGK